MTRTTGVLFATKMEADSFLEHTRPDHCIVIISGMGMEAAGSAARTLIEHHGVSRVVNGGICGALDDALRRGSVFFVSEALTEDQRDSVTLEQTRTAKRLVTVDKPVFETDRKETLSTFADLVDMEGYAIAKQCRGHNVPCVLVKGITDFGDPGGKADIKKHIALVSRSVSEIMLDYLNHVDR